MTTDIVPVSSTVVERHQSPAAPVLEDRALRFLEAQAQQLARTNLVPPDLRGKPDDVLAVVSWGHVIGLTPAVAVQEVHVIKGRPFPSARAVVSAANVRGHRVRVIRSDAKVCTVRAHRAGDPESWAVEVSFTIEDAKTAGLLSNPNYAKHPADMLFARASRRAVKMIAPEVLLGMAEMGFAFDDEPDPPSSHPAVTEIVDQPAAIEAASAPATAPPAPSWPESWAARCTALGCEKPTSKALIYFATQGVTSLSVDVPEPDRAVCDLLLERWAEDRPADVRAWLDEPEGEG